MYIINQNHPNDHPSKPGEYDEQKVMLGFDSADAAKRAYLKQYNRPDFFRSITAMHIDKFKKAMYQDKGEKKYPAINSTMIFAIRNMTGN